MESPPPPPPPQTAWFPTMASPHPPPQRRHFQFEFPPPPPYPPPDAAPGPPSPSPSSTPPRPPTRFRPRAPPPLPPTEEEASAGASEPTEYSYAYYEPDSRSCQKHTFTTRYGTEENIYEEISEVAAKLAQQQQQHQQPQRPPSSHRSRSSLAQSVVEEEVRRVQSRHRRVLGELNLAVEAMLMPPAPPPDLLEDLLLSVGPTDELLSPASPGPDPDSGFSSSCVSYSSSSRSSSSFPRSSSAHANHAAPGFWKRIARLRSLFAGPRYLGEEPDSSRQPCQTLGADSQE